MPVEPTKWTNVKGAQEKFGDRQKIWFDKMREATVGGTVYRGSLISDYYLKKMMAMVSGEFQRRRTRTVIKVVTVLDVRRH